MWIHPAFHMFSMEILDGELMFFFPGLAPHEDGSSHWGYPRLTQLGDGEKS